MRPAKAQTGEMRSSMHPFAIGGWRAECHRREKFDRIGAKISIGAIISIGSAQKFQSESGGACLSESFLRRTQGIVWSNF